MSLGPAEEGEHFVVDDIGDRQGEPSADERQLPLLSESVLHGRGELPQLGDLVVVDLVERDEQPGLMLGQQIGD